ncbi:hypothetical protein PBRA_007063 [Plasmodiophora brassicae]|uniref:TPPC8 C-terminal Ig-like domain-containing protein n=1 Tax=Plasmodiophora brassicae TaxID=37360 RepID=A0A0G4IUX9_PLABS|nr:hypothetical protein PBRA_007063 [Plasmodiophora brassicae]
MEDRDLIVALAVTDRVTQRFEDHNLTPCQVFQANRSVYVLDKFMFQSATRTFELDSLSVRFIPVSRLFDHPGPPMIPSVSEFPDFRRDVVIRDENDVSDFMSLANDPTPWFALFMRNLNDALLYNPVHFVEEPDEVDPVRVFSQLRDKALAKPNVYSDICPDYGVQTRFVLLCTPSDHDTGGLSQRARTGLEAMRRAFDPGLCSTLMLESELSAESPAVHQFVHDLLRSAIIPQMSSRICALFSSIVAIRKGFRNQLTSFFRPRQRPSRPDTTAAPVAQPSAPVEVQTRQLSDYAYLMGDIHLALEYFRAASADARGKDRLRGELARAEAGTAVCLASLSISDAFAQISVREIESSFEAAIKGYLELGMFASAAQVVGWEAILARSIPGLARHAVSWLVRLGTRDNSELAALFMEQAALVWVSAQPPMCREYAFFLVRAAHLYTKLGLRSNSIRCYSDALCVYEGHNWLHIEDHIRFKLGRELYNCGDYNGSLQHFVRLLGGGRQSQTRQETFFKEFLIVFKHTTLTTTPIDLDVPCFTFDQFVFGEASEIPLAVESDVWSNYSAYADADLSNIWSLCFWNQTLPLGSSVSVTCTIRNPLAIAVSLRRLRLDCEFTPLDRDVGSLELSETDLDLPPLETTTVVMSIVPKHPGTVLIRGLTWIFLDMVIARVTIPYATADLSATSQKARVQRWVQSGLSRVPYRPQESPARPLSFEVRECRPPLAHVSFSLESFPDELRFGELTSGIIIAQSATDGVQLFVKSSKQEFATVKDPIRLCSGINRIAVSLRGGDEGVHDIRLLLRYSTGGDKAIPFRTAHLKWTVSVIPSIRVDGSCRSAFDLPRHRAVEFIVGNETDDGNMVLDRLVLLQSGSRPCDVDELGDTDRVIQPGQEFSFHTIVKPSAGPSPRSVIECRGRSPSPTATGNSDLVWFRHSPAKDGVLDFVLFWSTDDGSRRGAVISRVADHAEATPQAGCPLRISVDFSSEVDHDFYVAPLACVPVEVKIFNGSRESVSFAFETLNPETYFDTEERKFATISTPCTRGRSFWAGCTRRSGISLEPEQSITIALQATFTHPGVFAINRMRFLVDQRRDESAEPRMFYFPVQRLIHIRQISRHSPIQ